MKKEIEEQLEGFRKLRDEADKGGDVALGEDLEEGGSVKKEDGEVVWGGGQRKRKRAREKEGLRGVKVRRASSSGQQMSVSADDKPVKGSSPDVVHEADAMRKDGKARSPGITEGTAEATLALGGGEKAEEEDLSAAKDAGSSAVQKAENPGKSQSAVTLGLGGYSSDEE